MTPVTIDKYITQQKSNFETQKVRVGKNWEWNMYDHIQLIFHLKYGIFYTGNNDYLRAFKNIMLPMLQLSYWTEDIDVKDTLFYVDGENDRAVSFLLKKYHDEVFTRKHDLDEVFDLVTEQDLDFGGCLVLKTNSPKPEVKHLVEVAFADQTNLTGGVIGFKYNFSPDGIRKMSAAGWGDPNKGANVRLEELVMLASAEKSPDGTTDSQKNDTTSKNIEVYVVKGELPDHYLTDSGDYDNWYGQVQVVAFYKDAKGKKQNCVLYRQKSNGEDIKFFSSSPIPNRALGYGIGESMLHPQIWTNFLNIHKMNMIEAGSKVPLQTDDPSFTNRNEVQDMDNLEVALLDEGKSIRPIDTIDINKIQVHAQAINEWYEQAQLLGSAFDPMLGKEAVSGTTFKGQERTVAQGRGSHDRRRGKRAKFIEEIYRDFIIPQMVREITKGDEFLADLSVEEVTWLRDRLTTKYVNGRMKERLLDFDKEPPTEEEKELLREQFKKDFNKGENKVLLKVLKDEFKNAEIRMGINIANKQKDIRMLSDKLLSVFQFIFQNPQGFQQAMQNKALAQSFNDILEYSGLSQADFTAVMAAPEQPPQQEAPQAPQQELLAQPTV